MCNEHEGHEEEADRFPSQIITLTFGAYEFRYEMRDFSVRQKKTSGIKHFPVPTGWTR